MFTLTQAPDLLLPPPSPVSILYKSIAGRYRPVRVADGPITARCRFVENASWVSSSASPSYDSFSFLNTLNLSKHLSFIHYNVQSIANKLDILSAELSDFDILAFSETWLYPNIQTPELLIPNFKPPERKDRTRDRHGGVVIYIRDSDYHKRRYDLEPRDTECMWIEIQLNHTRLLFGLFYRPPKSDMSYYSSIEDSISLAMDTQINNIIITGDFNLDILSH